MYPVDETFPLDMVTGQLTFYRVGKYIIKIYNSYKNADKSVAEAIVRI